MRKAARCAAWVPAVLLLPARALACAVCVDGTKLDLGFLWSALFLMAVPFVMAGVIGGWLYYSFRNPRRGARVNGLRLTLTGTTTKKESEQ